MTTIVLDTESNGSKFEQMCQLSFIVADNGIFTGENYFFSVDSMNPYAQKKHGFSKKLLYDLSLGRTFAQRVDEFIEKIVSADLICGHNVKSDMRLLDLCMRDAGYKLPPIKTFCTMQHFDNAANAKDKHGKHKPPRLDELCKLYSIGEDNIQGFCLAMFGHSAYKAHDARYDAAATFMCINEAQKRGDLKGVI